MQPQQSSPTTTAHPWANKPVLAALTGSLLLSAAAWTVVALLTGGTMPCTGIECGKQRIAYGLVAGLAAATIASPIGTYIALRRIGTRPLRTPIAAAAAIAGAALLLAIPSGLLTLLLAPAAAPVTAGLLAKRHLTKNSRR